MAAFHALARDRADSSPHAMNATATHDTKRGEDARARIDVLSETTRTWQRPLSRWSKWNQGHRRRVQEHLAPDANEEVFIYQTLLGAWPADAREIEGFRERLRAYLVKAAREAKIHTSWLEPLPDHEDALLAFVDAILTPDERNRFLPDFLRVQRQVARHGLTKSLAQLLLKITAPGVPDFYQGTELWDLSLADPDNRRPVDFDARSRMLAALDRLVARPTAAGVRELLRSWPDGRITLYVTRQALAARKRWPSLFNDGRYQPLEAAGEQAGHVVAFARGDDRQFALVVVPRLVAQLSPAARAPLGRRTWGTRC